MHNSVEGDVQMSTTVREELKTLIDDLDEPQVLKLWRVAASMAQPEKLTPEESACVDQILKEMDAGEFIDWQDMRRDMKRAV